MSTLDWLEEATIITLQKEMVAGRITARRLMTYYLERIAALDSGGPKLNSILELNPDAVFLAEALDHERIVQGPRSLLHGIPVLIKDNIDTGDKMHTSAGSLALANSYAKEDAFLISRLRQAGAIILGKTNMTEWANFMTRGMKNGYSSRGGQVLNPYGPGVFDVGGSSSGSGAAIAANLATIAVGTETSGSIISPANRNSIVGIKPTVGLISRHGIIPIAPSQDTAGPLARNVTDAAILLGALAGVDPRDPATLVCQDRSQNDYSLFLDANGLQGARLGVPRNYYERLDDDSLQLMQSAIAAMEKAGATIVDPVTIPSASAKTDNKVLVYEFKPALNAYLGKLSPQVPVHTLRELIAYNQQNAETMLKYGQTLLIESEATSGTLTEPEYIRARLRDLQLSREEGIDAALANYDLDALLLPGAWGASLAAKAGYPSICVPAGYLPNGSPMGVTFVASAFEEPLLIKLAYAFEQATRKRRPPQL
ncbi:MAG: amidase [Firmicutes bacterium]|nr:amidase [Bacillota bacterium]